MKKLVFVLAFCTLSIVSFSQQFQSGRQKHDGKPAMFNAVASRFAPSQNFISDVMNARLNQKIDLVVTNGFRFKGEVSAITSDAPGLTTVTIQSTDRPGLILSISKITLADQSITYRGIMISQKHSDMMMMEKDPVTGSYNWNRKQVSHMIAD
ncbi:MAG: hypothetical protein GXC73_12060 [Chitinophagaceae bacterium]|nr:hypothetical protein [Chitinophagaceae bacterium]